MYYQTKNGLLANFIFKHFPNRNDNLKQLAIKLLYIIVLIAIVISSCEITKYFIQTRDGYNLIVSTRDSLSNQEIPTKKDSYNLFTQNSDFKGWINIKGTNISNPVYQTDNNKFYLNHNQLKQESPLGSLFFDCNSDVAYNNTDKNIVIYGKSAQGGQLFSDLKKYKSAYFLNQNPTVTLTLNHSSDTYFIYSAFLINTSKSHDNGNIYNYKQNVFDNEYAFSNWVDESKQRSYFKTDISVLFDDRILTLVTDSDEFSGAKFVVMARKIRYGEPYNDTPAVPNQNPRFPAIWYTKQGIDNPFE